MKKLVLVLLALVLPTTLLAMDLNPGTIELSGRTAFNYSDQSFEEDGQPDIDVTTVEFRFDGSYYVLRNLGVGLFIQYDDQEVDVEGAAGPGLDSSTVIIGPQLIYNFPLGPKFNLFVNGAIGYAAAEVQGRDADGYALQVGGGVKYFINNSISVNGTLGYQFLTLEGDESGRDVDLSGLFVGAGLSVYF